jgi:DNA-binding NarL/FixJ family response regulator
LAGFVGPQRVHRVLWRPGDQAAPFHDSLTAREVEVRQHVAQGNSNADIAEALVIAPATATRHVANIRNKTGAANRNEAASYTTRTGCSN